MGTARSGREKIESFVKSLEDRLLTEWNVWFKDEERSADQLFHAIADYAQKSLGDEYSSTDIIETASLLADRLTMLDIGRRDPKARELQHDLSAVLSQEFWRLAQRNSVPPGVKFNATRAREYSRRIGLDQRGDAARRSLANKKWLPRELLEQDFQESHRARPRERLIENGSDVFERREKTLADYQGEWVVFADLEVFYHGPEQQAAMDAYYRAATERPGANLAMSCPHWDGNPRPDPRPTIRGSMLRGRL